MRQIRRQKDEWQGSVAGGKRMNPTKKIKEIEKELTQVQKARIYCVKHGQANYVTKFWGYVYCGRCGMQIGDQLAGCFDTRKLIVVGCKIKNCKVCPRLIVKLSPFDKKIFEKVRQADKKGIVNHEKVLKGISFD